MCFICACVYAGYMFGKGVYFADMVSKSANYCNTNRGSNIACMLLCEVALGEMNELTHADYNASTLPAGKHSTKGLGANLSVKKRKMKNILLPIFWCVRFSVCVTYGFDIPVGYSFVFPCVVLYSARIQRMHWYWMEG
jgi:hypothetical protein